MMVLVKLLLLAIGVTAQTYALNPPNIRPPSEQLREQHGAEHWISSIVMFERISVWAWALLEGLVLFALSGYCPPALARLLLSALPTRLAEDSVALGSLTVLTPAFVAGTVCVLVGTLLRAYCYRALGPQFTFQLSIRPAHALVTHGVYSIVRHPSYTGLAANALGYFLCALDPRGTIAAMLAGALGDGAAATGALACLWATGVYLMHVFLYWRMKKEDAMLESRFGEEWRAWSKRVPCWLIPGIY